MLGTVLPDTGNLSAYGPATQAAVRLAVDDANAAGAFTVRLVPGDSGDAGAGTFARTVERLRAGGVQALIGPLSSPLLLDELDAIAGLPTVSPATTSLELTGDVFRVVPSDAAQGAVLARLAAQAGVLRLAVVAPREFAAVADAAQAEGRARGIEVVVVGYPASARPAEVAARVARARADGLLLASAAETNGILRALLRGGMPANAYVTSMSAGRISADDLPRGTLRGAQVLSPDTRVSPAFGRRLDTLVPGARERAYSPQAYDAAAITILAAAQADRMLGEVTSAGISAFLPAVTTSGVTCDTVASCLRKVADGIDIDYSGVSGTIDLGIDGTPVSGSFAVRTYGADNVPGSRARYVRFP